MNASRKVLLKLIQEMPDNQIPAVIDFIAFLKLKKKQELFKELEMASVSSMDFWDNDIDDETWNNV
jgi:hypothetical protein